MSGDGVRDWPRVVAHADMDAFYASVEQLDNPSLRGLPVIVGGSSRRGVVTSASYEARKFGVRSAMPAHEAHRLCPNGVFVPGRMTRYVEVSRAVRAVFDEFSPIVEPLSLDEAFLDLTGTHRVFASPLAAGRALKERMRAATGLVVSVGIAPTKMAAKILSDLSKPDGLQIISPGELVDFLAPLPVERLWGVGRVMLARLQAAGIVRIGDLARTDAAQLRSRLGSAGLQLHELALGHDARPVDGDWARKSYGEESTFERDLEIDSLELARVLIAHSDALGRRLRAGRVRARTVTLKLKLARALGQGRYPIVTRSQSLPAPIDDGAEIARTARAMLSRVRERERVRLAGVQVHNLVPDMNQTEPQLALFGATIAREARRDRLNRALDQVVARFGETAVTRGLARAERAAPTRRIK
jgi:DNA polymerase-4